MNLLKYQKMDFSVTIVLMKLSLVFHFIVKTKNEHTKREPLVSSSLKPNHIAFMCYHFLP